MPVQEKICRSALCRSGIAGTDYCLNPYTGCAHACRYCYASFMKRFSGHQEPWGGFVDAKINVAERLTAQLKRPKQGTVLLSSVTDPYQPIEADYRLTRACLERLVDTELEVSVLTKSDMVRRDLDLMRKLPGCNVGMTITTPDDGVSQLLEPGAPPTSRRLTVLRELIGARISTWVFIAPALPWFTDQADVMDRLFALLAEAGVPEVKVDPLNFYPAAVAGIRQLIARRFPEASAYFQWACHNQQAYRVRLRSLVARVAPRHGYPPEDCFF